MPSRILAYYVAHTGKSLLWTAADMLPLYVLITVYHMDPATAGAAFLIGLAANALADLGAGFWLDRARSGVAAVAIVALGVSTIAFSLTIAVGAYGFVPVLSAMLLFRIAYSFYDVPHNALLSQLSDSRSGAIALSRGRTIGTGVAGIAVCLLLRTGPVDARAVTISVFVIALTGLILGLAVIPLLRTSPDRVDAPHDGSRPSVPLDFLAGSIVGIVALGGLGKALLHLPVTRSHPAPGDLLLLLVVGRTAASLVPLDRASRWVERHGLPVAYLGSAGIALAIGRDAQPSAVLLLGFALGLTNLLGWARLPALVRSAGGYGLYTMASKLALGAAGMTMAALLGIDPLYSLSGFRAVSDAAAIACIGAAVLFATARRA